MTPDSYLRSPDHGPHLLVADEEPSIVGVLTSALLGVGFRVTAVRGVDAALHMLAEPQPLFDGLILAPGALPQPEALAAIRACRPRLPVLILAQSTLQTKEPSVQYLAKPFPSDRLVQAVHLLLSAV